jgi:predicted alpha-1,6-mannanase (GH76 family)
MDGDRPSGPRAARADAASRALVRTYWHDRSRLFRVREPVRVAGAPSPWLSTRWCPTPWHYWWQAHALDALADAYERSPRPQAIGLARRLVGGVVRRNGGRVVNDYYDDMAWLALALERWSRFGPDFQEPLEVLRQELIGGYDPGRGAVLWRRGSGFCNVAANAPVCMVAARAGDLELAERLADWLHKTLVDPATAEVYDGIEADGTVSRAAYSYNYGTVIGADLALYAATGDEALVARARRVAHAALRRLAPNGLVEEAGTGDGGLFKGILARHLATLVRVSGDEAVRTALRRNADAAWLVRTPDGLIGTCWLRPASGPVELSAHLSGVLLLEAVATIEP